MSLGDNSIICITVLSATTLMYYVEAGKYDKHTAKEFLKGYKIIGVEAEDYEWASVNDEGDFEDAVQVACARRTRCALVLTLDKEFVKMYGKYISVRMID